MTEPCRIELESRICDVSPGIRRRFEIPGECTLHDLHEVMQVLHGWADYHMYNFTIDGRRYEKIHPEVDQRDPHDAEATTIRAALDGEEQFQYCYDFGDMWEIDLTVCSIREETEVKQPLCLDGERAGPPEDCGGSYGYEEFLEAIENPDHDDHERMTQWIGADFQIPYGRSRSRTGEELDVPDRKCQRDGESVPWNPEAFDTDRINRDLEEIHWCYQHRLGKGSIEYELTGLRIPDELKGMVRDLFEETDRFAARHLGGDPEYVRLFHRAAVKLARKQPSPLKRGQFKNWVGGIVYGIGSANYLFDPNEAPHLPGQKIGELLDIPDSTIHSKANRVKDELDIGQFDTEWLRKDLILQMPFFWNIRADGEVIDARRLGEQDYNRLREQGVIPDVSRDQFPKGTII